MLPAIMAGAAVAGPILGGIIGQQASKADREAAQAAMQRAFDQINAVGAPPDLSKEIILKEFKSAGILTPENEKNISAGVSQLSQLQTDQTGRNAQVGALQLLQQRATGGLAPEDRLKLNQIRNQVGQENQSRLDSIRQNMQARGQAGGGAELAAALSAAQGSANNESQQGDQLAAMASQNALQAALQSGQLGGQLNASDFSQGAQKASAADQFKMFDTQNSIGQQQRNVAAQNQAQAGNLANAQQISNANIGQSNQEKLRQNDAQRQNWLDQFSLQQAKANAATGQASQLGQQAASTAQQYQGIGSGVGSGAGTLLSAYAQNPKMFSSSTDAAVKKDANGNPIS